MNSKKIISGYFALASIEAGAGLVSQLLTPSDADNQFLWGYSLPRLALIGGFLLIFILLAWLAARAWREPDWTERIWQRAFVFPQKTSRLLWASSAVSILLVTILFVPPYRFSAGGDYVERLHPALWWGALIGAQTSLVLLYGRTRPKLEIFPASAWRKTAPAIGIAFLGLLLTWGFATQFDASDYPNGLRGRYPAGVPLLSGQVWFLIWLVVLAVSVGGAHLKRVGLFFQQNSRKTDLLIGLGIWAIAAVLWITTPLPKNFFFPGPYPPENVIYPYADAASWDTGAHFAFIGQGLDNSDPFQDHIGWSGFLALLHLFLGEDYALISGFQTALLAIFPALIYWLGSLIHNRLSGLFLAALAIIHELNAFAASNMIDLSHVRFLLTEYPARVGLAVLALWLFLWLRAPRQGMAYALPIGGLLAVSVLLRFSLLTMPFAVTLGIILVFGRDWKTGLRASLLTLLTLTLLLSPWMWRSWTISGTPFFFAKKTQKIFEEKFRLPPSATPTPPSSLNGYQFIAGDLRPSGDSLVRFNSSADLLFSTPTSDNQTSVQAEGSMGALKLILTHFAHNLTASALILPTHIEFHDLSRTIYEIHPYWEKFETRWQGNLTIPEATLLAIHLAFISIGIGIAWRKWKLVGLVPLGVCLAYALSLAVARTSGGRYIVPMDWGVLFYWGMGITQTILWGAAWFGTNVDALSSHSEPKTFSFKKGWLFLLPFLLFVVAMTVMDRTVPQRYSEMEKSDILAYLEETGALDQAGISSKELAAFLKKKNSQAFLGRGLYPRYYRIGEGEHMKKVDAYDPMQYPRLSFTIIGTFGEKGVVLPFMNPLSAFPNSPDTAVFSNASDVIVFGCLRPKYKGIVDAILVVILDEKPLLYLRQPEAPLKCPLPEPVCETYKNCR